MSVLAPPRQNGLAFAELARRDFLEHAQDVQIGKLGLVPPGRTRFSEPYISSSRRYFLQSCHQFFTGVVGECGFFGRRIAEIGRRHGLEVVEVEADWGEAVPNEHLLEALEA